MTVDAINTWKQRNPEKVRAYKKRYRDSEKGQIQRVKNAERMKLRRQQNPELYRAKNRVVLGAIDPHGEEKHGPCEICAIVCDLHYDHDHSTGLFRGWLCGPCNRALGSFRDSENNLEAALVYLRKSRP